MAVSINCTQGKTLINTFNTEIILKVDINTDNLCNSILISCFDVEVTNFKFLVPPDDRLLIL